MDQPRISTKALWKTGIRSLDEMWTDSVRELWVAMLLCTKFFADSSLKSWRNSAIEDIPDDELVDVSRSTVLSREKVRRLKSSLRKLASTVESMCLEASLKKLASTIESVQLDIRACIPGLSLCDTPDEVILEILQLACTDCYTVVDASLVCKRFRCIALSSSKLWAACTLTTCMPPHIIDMVAYRSGSHGLTVELENMAPRWSESSKRSLTRLFEYSARWKTLVSILSKEASRFIFTRFPRENVSALAELVVCDGLYGIGNHQSSFYKQWSLPSLRVLSDSTPWLPQSSFANKAPNLIECHLASDPSAIPRLVQFLNAALGLEKLQLTLHDPNDTFMDSMLQSPTLNLSALWTLILNFPRSWGQSTVEYILPVLLCPSIREIALRLYDESYQETDRTILGCKLGLLSLHRRCPFLESFSLSIFGRAGREKLYVIDDIIQQLPNSVKNIRLHIGGDVQLFSHNPSSFSLRVVSESNSPCLMSLSIEFQSFLGMDFLPQLVTQLKLRKIRLKGIIVIHNRIAKSIKLQETQITSLQ